jgi:uncharacterized protein YhaN
MRFAELELIKYGRFEGHALSFPHNHPDLHIVFGPNEAGKSTTMAAISDLLFGFPHITPYDFRFDKQLLKVGALLQADGIDLVCRRKKGRVGTLLDGHDRVLDDGALTALLAGYSGESFQRMFSLDHGRLREGGRAILQAKDDIGQAIFAAGSGLVGIAALVEGLEEEAKEIWTRRTGDRRYYAAQREFDEAKARQKAAVIKPAAWDELRQQVDTLDAAIHELRSRRSECQREREVVERRRRVLPHAALYRRAEAELASLAEAPLLPAGAAETLNQIAIAIAAAETEIGLATAERDKVLAALGDAVFDQRLIERSGDIEALRETKGAIDKSLGDLPRRRTELSTRGLRLAELLPELGWAEAPASVIKTRLPQRVRVAELRSLLETRSALDATLSAASADEATAHQALVGLRAELDEMPEVPDIRDFSAVLKFARGAGDLDAAVSAAKREADRRAAALSSGLAVLAPWSGTADALRCLVLPSDAELAAAQVTMAQTALAAGEAKREHQAELDRGQALDLQRTHLVRDDRAVSPDTIARAREDRDLLWRGIRAHLVDEQPLSDPAESANDFERRSGIADSIADRRYAAAEQSARLVALQEEVERNALAVERQRRRLNEALMAAETATRSWAALLAPTSLVVEPKAFSAWSDRRRRALDMAEEAETALATVREAERRRDDARARLIDALSAVGAPDAAGQPFGFLLQTAERIETATLEAAQRRRDLGANITAAETLLKRAEAKRRAAERDFADWQTRWAAAVAAAGLNPESSPAVIRAQLDLLEELRGDVDEILSLQQRIAALEADIGAFSDAVLALAGACGVIVDGRTPLELLLELGSAVRQAMALKTRRTALEEQVAALEQRVHDAETARTRALALFRPLSEAAGTTDRAELAAAVGRSDRARHLRAELDRSAEEIVMAGAGPPLADLLTESESADASALIVRSNALQDELALLSDEIAQLTGDRATAQASFARLDDGPDAAIAAADAELARAEMAAQSEAYIRKRAEVALLKWGIKRYRAEKQTPLLRRASGIFSKLTLGRYSELLVDLDGDRAQLAGLGLDHDVVPVEKMSEGTVDQLFLALRLAAVEDSVAAGATLPFLADDLFINYDDERAAAGFEVLAELAKTTQVLFFTHHQHLAALAEAALGASTVSRSDLG